MTWTAVAILLAGIVIGAGVKFGYLRVHGARMVVPYIERTDQAFTVGVIAVTVMSLVTIVQTSASAAENENCARQFRDALTYNTGINADSARINAERLHDFDALLGTIVANAPNAQSAPPTPESNAARSMRNARAIETYRDKATALDREQAAALKTRAAYPDPTCGRAG